MLIENKKVVGLRVVTETAQEIGKIRNFDIETDSQSIINYKISPTSLLKGILQVSENLIINRGQVVSISEDKMIVEDSVITAKNENTDKLANKKTAVMPAMKIISKK
jgi:sporulation protein YlmC with PRC-barrel domain